MEKAVVNEFLLYRWSVEPGGLVVDGIVTEGELKVGARLNKIRALSGAERSLGDMNVAISRIMAYGTVFAEMTRGMSCRLFLDGLLCEDLDQDDALVFGQGG